MLAEAFNSLAFFHSRAATLKRLSTPTDPEITTGIRITPCQDFRNQQGPSEMIIEGREFIIPLATIASPFTPVLKRGDRIVDSQLGTMTIEFIQEVYDVGAVLMGFRVKAE